MAGDSEVTGRKCEREGKGRCVERESEGVAAAETRDWECQSSATSHPRNVLASAAVTNGNAKKERNRNLTRLFLSRVIGMNKLAPIGETAPRTYLHSRDQPR